MNTFVLIYFLAFALSSASVLHTAVRPTVCSSCKVGTTCVGSGIDAKCATPASVGGRCGISMYSICKPGVLCENGRCVQYVAAGGACRIPQQICNSGFVCNFRRVCAPPVTIVNLGDSCIDPEVSKCDESLSLVCKGGICTQPGVQGQTCNNPGVICEPKTSCVGSTGSKSCKAVSTVGETCADASLYSCADGLVCDGTICTKTIPKGSSCWRAGLICETGTTCLGFAGAQTCKSVSNVGEKCAPKWQYECADPLQCDGKICTQTVPDGDTCEGPGIVCNTGSTCFGPIGTKACKIVSGLGEVCPDLGKYACTHGLTCDGTICTKTVRKGAKCETSGVVCEAGSTCEGTLGMKTCKVTLGVGRTCSNKMKTMCADTLTCNGSICTQAVIDGEPCEVPGIVCTEGSTCHGRIGSKACKIVSDLGGTCPDLGKYACADGLTCDGTICTKDVLKGEKCDTPGLICERGSACLGLLGRKTCKSTQTVGLTCANASKFVCADTLKCDGRICTQTVADGGVCQGPGLVCAPGSACRGPAGSKSCKAIGNVGDSCSDPSMSACRPGLKCDGTVCAKI